MNLKGKKVTVIIGHEPGGGADGERQYNAEVARYLIRYLRFDGALVYEHHHTIKSYGKRQNQMRKSVNECMPDCDVCIELHYNAYDNADANGAEFLYRGAQELAEDVRDEFAKAFPNIKLRRSQGLYRKLFGNGAGFLRKSPAWALIVEPGFRTNPSDWSYLEDNAQLLAHTYYLGIKKFLS